MGQELRLPAKARMKKGTLFPITETGHNASILFHPNYFPILIFPPVESYSVIFIRSYLEYITKLSNVNQQATGCILFYRDPLISLNN